LPLILPSGGESGLPNEAALADVATPSAAAAVAVLTRNSRRRILVIGCLLAMDVEPLSKRAIAPAFQDALRAVTPDTRLQSFVMSIATRRLACEMAP
jgi:hypothetical protein